MVIVDTTVWIDYLGGITNAQASWLDRELDRQRLGLTDLILCEGCCREYARTQPSAGSGATCCGLKYSTPAESIWHWQRPSITVPYGDAVTRCARPSIA